MDSNTAVPSCNKVPSCADIGFRAYKAGNFQLARQMLHTAMCQSDRQDSGEERHSRLVELMTHMADTYLIQGNYDAAKNWYLKAHSRSELFPAPNTWQAAGLMARLTQVHVLLEDTNEFEECLDKLMHTYLLGLDGNISNLLNPLVDLSWTLSVTGHAVKAQPINDLIAQIKLLEHEDRFSTPAA
jgi:hypothetical protein